MKRLGGGFLATRICRALAWLAIASSFAAHVPVHAEGATYRHVTTLTPAYLTPGEPVPVFSLLPGTPVEWIQNRGEWAQIRDAEGGLYWVPAADLDDLRTVIVIVDRAEIRSAPDPEAAIVCEVERNVVLALLGTSDGWAEVAVGSLRGFIPRSAVWGL